MRKTKKKKRYRVKKKESLLRNSLFLKGMGLIIFTFFLVYLFIFSSFFQVEEIKISGAQKIDPLKVNRFLQKGIERKIIIFKTKSIFLVNKNSLQKEFLSQFPQAERISLKKKFPRSILVFIKERKPSLIFCEDNQCFLVDENGIPFEKVDKDSNLFVVKNNLKKRKEIVLGEKIIEKKVISRIFLVKQHLENLKVISLSIEEPHKFVFKTEQGPSLYFDLNEDVSQQVFNLNNLIKEKIKLSDLKNIDYIDVRFGNRVYWKEKNSIDNEETK